MRSRSSRSLKADRCATDSGSPTIAMIAITTRNSTMTHGRRSGSGATSETIPASRVPVARPPMLAKIAMVAARLGCRGLLISSDSAAVAAPVTRAVANPASTRATMIIARSSATRNTVLAARARSRAARMTGRRPIRSETPPRVTSPTTTPSAYTAKTTVTVRDEKPNSCS